MSKELKLIALLLMTLIPSFASYLMQVVNSELKKMLTCWFYTNKLSINVKKSNLSYSDRDKTGKQLI